MKRFSQPFDVATTNGCTAPSASNNNNNSNVKPDSISQVIEQLNASNKLSSDEALRLKVHATSNEDFAKITAEFTAETNDSFNAMKYLFKFKNFLSNVSSTQIATRTTAATTAVASTATASSSLANSTNNQSATTPTPLIVKKRDSMNTSFTDNNSPTCIQPLDKSIGLKVKRLESMNNSLASMQSSSSSLSSMSPSKRMSPTAIRNTLNQQQQQQPQQQLIIIPSLQRIEGPKDSPMPQAGAKDGVKSMQQFGTFFKEIENEEHELPSAMKQSQPFFGNIMQQSLAKWEKESYDLEYNSANAKLDYLLNFLSPQKKQSEEINAWMVSEVTCKYKESKRIALELSRAMMVPASAQDLNLFTIVSFLKTALKSMFRFADFEVSQIENSTISLFRSHSITVATGNIRENERVKKNLLAFEEDRMFFLDTAERALIRECMIGDIPPNVFFVKKKVEAKIFLISFIVDTEEDAKTKFRQEFHGLFKKIADLIVCLLTERISDKSKFLLDLFAMVEEYLKLQKFILVRAFQDAFQDIFSTALCILDHHQTSEIEHSKQQSPHTELELKGVPLISEDVEKGGHRTTTSIRPSIRFPISIGNSEFAFYTTIDDPQKINRSLFFKHFESIVTQVYQKHKHLVARVLDRFSERKLSLNYNQVVFFEFNKTGSLSFINYLPSKQLQKACMMVLPEMIGSLSGPILYTSIFKDNDAILHAIKESFIVKTSTSLQYSIPVTSSSGTPASTPATTEKESADSSQSQQQIQFHLVSSLGVKGKVKVVKLQLKDDFDKNGGNRSKPEKIQSPILHSSTKTYNSQIKNKLAFFTAAESKSIILSDNDAKNSTVVEFLSQVEQLKVNEEQKALYLKKTSSPNWTAQKRNIRCIADVQTENNENAGYLNRLFTMRRMTGTKLPSQLPGVAAAAGANTIVKVEDLKMDDSLSSELDSFSINVWKYDEPTKIKVIWTILEKRNYFAQFQIPHEEFLTFLYKMRSKYNKRDNPFHNFDHAIMVMHSCYMIGCNTDANKYLNKTQEFSLIFSGLCHDASHRARTNAFEVNTMSKLAIRYHDQSVLEQHHIATTFKVLRQSSANIFKNLTIQKVQQIRKYVINNIMATDMSKHFDFLKDFQVDFLQHAHTKELNQFEEKEINLLTGTIIHTSDFHHTAQKFEFSRQWSAKVNKEFSQQYIEEGRQGVQQTSYLKDLDKMHIIAKNEAGFIKMIVRPLWETMNKFLNNQLSEPVANLDQSILEWNKLQEQAQKEEEEAQRMQELNKLKQPMNSLNSKLKNLI